MPWHIESKHPNCSGYAVVKDSDGSLAGCHKTKKKALDQLAALYANESADRPRQMERSGFIAPLEDVEWRVAGNSHDYTFTGRAVVFDSWSEPLATPLGVFRERIMPGAFANVLEQKPDVRLLFNHDENLVLARTKAGTLELEETDYGLHVWARVAPTSYAKDLKIVMARGDVDQMSFAFGMDEDGGAEDRWYEDKDSGEIRRDVLRVSHLFDVSPVTYPAYVDTQAAMRELRAAADAGKIDLPTDRITPGVVLSGSNNFVAPEDLSLREFSMLREILAVADTTSAPTSAEAETDPPVGDERDASASAETDPAVGGTALERLKAHSQEAVRSASERHLLIKKEITR